MYDSRYITRSCDNINWWEPEVGRRPRKVASLSYMNFNLEDLRNGYLTLDDGDEGEAKFQQKQMEERELKIASLYESQQARALERVRMSPAHSNGSSNNSTHNESPRAPLPPGKVRQMFEERRSKGIDKSYPLQPIHNNVTNRNNVSRPAVNGHGPTTRVSHARSDKKPVRSHATPAPPASYAVRKQPLKSVITNGSGDVNHNVILDKHEAKIHSRSQAPGLQSVDTLDKGDRVSKAKVDRNQNHYRIEDETFPEALAEEVTPRSPEPKKPARRSNVVTTKQTTAEVHQPVPPPRKAAVDNKVSRNIKTNNNKEMSPISQPAAVVKKQSAVPSATKRQVGPAGSRQSRTQPASVTSSGVASASGGAGVACTVCGRRFHPDRIAKHEEICKKAATKKRKPFDALKHRLAGTEAEPFINKVRKMKANPSQTKIKPLNSTWRKKHDDFIQAIRAAKQVQQHLAAGGNIRDLPPPPPSENPDYVQCPHCNRRFNQGAAERHIPKCASFQFNKPKPGAAKKR